MAATVSDQNAEKQTHNQNRERSVSCCRYRTCLNTSRNYNICENNIKTKRQPFVQMTHQSTFLLFSIFAFLFIVFNFGTVEGNLLPEPFVQNLLHENSHLIQLYAPTLTPVQKFIGKVLRHSEQLGSSCSQSLRALHQGFLEKQLWALEYYDASGKGTSGRFAGYKNDLGNFDQCLSLRTTVPVTGQSFSGLYCAVSVQSAEYDQIVQQRSTVETLESLQPEFQRWVRFNLGHVFGLCLPSTCHPDTLFEVANQELKPNNVSLLVQRECTRSDIPTAPFSPVEKLAFFVFALAVTLVILGTAAPFGVLRNFCISRNLHKLFKPVEDFESRRVSAIHGAKFYYIMLSVSAHCWYIFMPILPLIYGGIKRFDIGHPLLKEISASSMLLPDGMFFLSGILTVYIWFPIIEKCNGKLSFTKYILSRWLRTAPLVAAVLLFMRISERFGSGPFFNELAAHEQIKCGQSFWMNLLFINNYKRGLEICMPHTWYLSADFQLYLFHYITVIMLYRKPKTGFILAATQILAAMAFTGLRTYHYNLPAYLRVNEATIVNLYDTVESQYLNSLLHSSCYTIGILCGYVIRRNISIINFASPFYRPIWILNIGASLSAFLIPYLWEHNWLSPNPLILALWSAVVRPLFLVGFFWGFICLYHRRAKLARLLFEQSFIQAPISRMALSIVVTQYVYIHYLLGSARQMQRFNTFDQIKESVSGTIFILCIGLITYLLFEAPIVNLMFDLLGTKQIQKEARRMSKLRVDLSEFRDENGNFKNETFKNAIKNGNGHHHLSPCSPDIETKQL